MNFHRFFQARSLRTTLALLILAAAILFAAYRMAWQSGASLSDRSIDPVSDWENHLQPLRSDLSKTGAGTVGYIADWDIPNEKYNQDDQDVEFILTQFALVPSLVQRGANHTYVIGNLTEENLPKALKLFHLSLQEEYGKNIYLLKGNS